MATRREEVYNITLAELLSERGAKHAEAEQRHRNNVPDVLFEWVGLHTVLEAKYNASGAAAEVTQQTLDRLARGFGPLGVALLYPAQLRTATGNVQQSLARATLRVRLLVSGQEEPGRWHQVTGIDGLTAILDQARAVLVGDDQLRQSVAALSDAVDALARVFAGQPGHADEIVDLVTAADVAATGAATADTREAAFRIAALAVITATMVQLILADRDPKVPKVPEGKAHEQRRQLLRSWHIVLDHDYGAVFEIAYHVLDTLGDTDPSIGAALVAMIEEARAIVTAGVMGRHDLIGRVYHGLLAQQKYLATYYTSVPAATLLAALATSPADWPDLDWAAAPGDFRFTVADPACGTGTLLAAALGAIRRGYVSARIRVHDDIDFTVLGKRMIEDNIFGYDILAYAVQVCAATLLLSSPGTIVTTSQLVQMPFGGPDGDLGSLNLLEGSAQGALFGGWGNTITLEGTTERNVAVNLPTVDLVIMNPPFTRSQGGSRLLGSLDPKEFPVARTELRRLVRENDVSGRISAGLGALFIPLADRMVRPGGRLAFVLPKTMLTGEQWDQTRSLLASKYHIECVICSHETGHWNFSDSTNLAELLLVARKWRDDERAAAGAETTWLQLSGNPDNAMDALAIASALQTAVPGARGQQLMVGGGLFSEVGEVFTRPTPESDAPWPHAMFFKESLLHAAESAVHDGAIRLPRLGQPVPLPLRPLHELGRIGYDRRDITDAFERVARPAGYPALWGTDAKKIVALQHATNAELSPRTSPAPGRTRIKPAEQVWAGAGQLLIPERLRLNTMRCAAIVVDQRCLSNTWWTVNLASDDPDDARILALWLNSTVGLVLWVYSAEETQGPWLAVKKNKLERMPVLDVQKLSAAARRRLLDCWTAIHQEPLAPIAVVESDLVRAQIDGAVAGALGIPADGLEALRVLFSAEPRLQPAKKRTATPPETSLYETPSLFD